jgi:flagellar biosynthesis anti-sigma factor FlgM
MLGIALVTRGYWQDGRKIKAFLTAADNQIARVRLSGGASMRIDLHVRSSEAAQTNRSSDSNTAGKGKSPAVDKAAVQTDETRLSSHQARVHELERAAKDVPEMRQERVESLKAAIQEGRYQPPPEQVAEAMFSDALARVDLLRR